MGEVRNGDQKVRKYLFSEIFYGRQAVSYEDFFFKNYLGWRGQKNSLTKIVRGAQYKDLGPSLTIQDFFSKKSSWFYVQRMCTLFGN